MIDDPSMLEVELPCPACGTVNQIAELWTCDLEDHLQCPMCGLASSEDEWFGGLD